MENIQNRGMTPSPEKVSSAADAMLRLSSSGLLDPVAARASAAHVQMQLGGHMSAMPQHGGNIPAAPQQMGYIPGGVPHNTAQSAAVPPQPGHSLPMPPVTSGLYVTDEDSQSSYSARQARKQREFIPEDCKDESYWSKRRKNNEAAKKSREKRRVNDMVLSQKIVELTNQNTHMQMEMNAMKHKFGWPVERQFPVEGTIPMVKNDYLSHSDSDSSNNSFTSDSFVSGTDKLSMPGFSHDSAPNNISGPHLLKSPGSNPGIRQHVPASPLPQREPEIPISVAQQMPMLLPLVQSRMPGIIPSALPNCLPRVAMENGMPFMHEGRNLQPVDADFPPPPLRLYPDGVRLPVPSQYNVSQDNDMNGLRREPVSPGYSSSSSSPGLKINLSQSSSESESVTTSRPAGAFTDPKRMRYDSQSDDRHYYGDLAKVVENSRGSGRKGVPFKLWHKISTSESHREIPVEGDESEPEEDFCADSTQNMVSSTSPDQAGSDMNHTSGHTDPRYTERRKRNNVAARKCRENRKLLNDIRLEKSTILETENNRLRDEMKDLAAEITGLRDLLDKKKQAQERGEPFQLPLAEAPPPTPASQASVSYQLESPIVPEYKKKEDDRETSSS